LVGFDSQPRHVNLRVLYQRIENILVKFLYSGDPGVMGYTLCDPYVHVVFFGEKQLQAYPAG
jgi:hypothetical protein